MAVRFLGPKKEESYWHSSLGAVNTCHNWHGHGRPLEARILVSPFLPVAAVDGEFHRLRFSTWPSKLLA